MTSEEAREAIDHLYDNIEETMPFQLHPTPKGYILGKQSEEMEDSVMHYEETMIVTASSVCHDPKGALKQEIEFALGCPLSDRDIASLDVYIIADSSVS